jgi:hypothetical protein
MEAVFSVWSVPKAYKRNEFSVVNTVVSRQSELGPGVQNNTGDSACDLKTLFMCNIWSV